MHNQSETGIVNLESGIYEEPQGAHCIHRILLWIVKTNDNGNYQKIMKEREKRKCQRF